eukprot:COSAG01_NODE_20586_length_946_cov_2.003542_1_plen_48_part_00
MYTYNIILYIMAGTDALIPTLLHGFRQCRAYSGTGDCMAGILCGSVG